MDFTREPIVESIITPKEGYKLVVRSSKGGGQEEFFVDSLEIVTFGHALFFRSLEKPKAFLMPVSDYEVLEVREARLVLKNVGIEKAIKIGGGREPKPAKDQYKEPYVEKAESSVMTADNAPNHEGEAEKTEEKPAEKKRDRRKHHRRRRGKDEMAEKTDEAVAGESGEGEPKGESSSFEEREEGDAVAQKAAFLTTLLPPPTTLISETIARYRDNALFKGAFFDKEQEGEPTSGEEATAGEEGQEVPSEAMIAEDDLEALDMQSVLLEETSYGFFEPWEDKEEQVSVAEDGLDVDIEENVPEFHENEANNISLSNDSEIVPGGAKE